MRKLERVDSSWSYRDFKSTISHIFYQVQNAWMERNQDLAKNCMSQSLYEDHRLKTDWMIVRQERNILKNMKLLEALPVEIEDHIDDNKDFIWVYIKAKMIDYTINEQTNEILSGSKISKPFV